MRIIGQAARPHGSPAKEYPVAKTTTWTGATELSSYFTATNWTNGVPGPTDTAIIPFRLPKAAGPTWWGRRST